MLIDLPGGEVARVGIERLHLEQDAGKSLHDQDPDNSFVDLNRAGVALMEIVTKPHMRASEEAAAFLKKLRAIVRYLGTCDGNMDEGSMRADVNVSVAGRAPMNASARPAISRFSHALRDQERQFGALYRPGRGIRVAAPGRRLRMGGTIKQETRLFDSRAGETRSMRSKEEAHDYRYFPDPDLLPLVLEQGWVDEIAASLPELPDEKKARFMALGLSPYDASVLVAEKETADYFEAMLAEGADAKAAANWLNNEYFGAPQ